MLLRDEIPDSSLRDDNPYETMDERDEVPGAGCLERDDRPYDTMLLRDEIPESTLRDDNPYDTIDERDEVPGAGCLERDDRP